jgi:hypothetical protein
MRLLYTKLLCASSGALLCIQKELIVSSICDTKATKIIMHTLISAWRYIMCYSNEVLGNNWIQRRWDLEFYNIPTKTTRNDLGLCKVARICQER